MKKIILCVLMVFLTVAAVTGCSNCGNGVTPGACEEPAPAK